MLREKGTKRQRHFLQKTI